MSCGSRDVRQTPLEFAGACLASARPSPGMVRHRKPSVKGGKGKGAKPAPRAPDRKDSKIKAWNKPEDIPKDDQDLCAL